MPNKPDKYGIKFWLLVEVDSKYVSNIIPYLGAAEKEMRGNQTLAENVVVRLIEPLKNRGYNVCCDNFSLRLMSRIDYLRFRQLSLELFEKTGENSQKKWSLLINASTSQNSSGKKKLMLALLHTSAKGTRTCAY